MKPLSFLTELPIVSYIKKEAPFYIKKEEVSFLPLVLKNLKNRSLILYDSSFKGVDDLVFSFEEKGVFFETSFLKKDVSPEGFLGQKFFYKELFLNALSSGFKNHKYVVFPADLYEKPLFSTPLKRRSFWVTSNCDYDFLIQKLRSFGFKEVDFIKDPGDFSVRGFVVDFFPFDFSKGVRVLFDKGAASIYFLNTKDFLSFKKISKYFVVEKTVNNSSFSLKGLSLFSSFIYAGADRVCFFSSCPKKRLSFGFSSIPLEDCLKFKKGASFFSEKASVGFGFKGEVFIPSWLKDKKASSLLFDPYVDFSTLVVGDFLVHEDFGVGKYLGLQRKKEKDFLFIKYSDSVVSVASDLFSKISFYKKGGEGVLLDCVGKKARWESRLSRFKKKTSLFVDSLVRSYVEREGGVSDVYYLDSSIESSFLKGFPFRDTRDQKESWKEIKKDLLGARPMDRLLCGDVGFGKTELAIRASFVAGINGFKVIVLAPTTILAKQLYFSFFNRLKEFGLSVGFVSRFVNKPEKDRVFLDFYNGKVDVLVGTHSVVQNKTAVSSSSLVIVDDEHKFGVKQKEEIKKLNPFANFLYMSATPIPRTLKLALSDFKKMSLLSTPPSFKRKTETFVEFFSEKLIKKVVLYEISRGGQVFFVHNNIKTMPKIVSLIKKCCPFAFVEFLHGKEPSSEIEKKMDSFINKKIDILVASSIIENGIDIPSVNTIIINNAHLLGVSQLYQMRGRVGRSSFSSFAYLLVPFKKPLSVEAASRLKIIEKNTALGSCYSVAMEDLSLRGGGSLFGYSQSGGKDFLGVELYSKVLADLVSKVTKQPVSAPAVISSAFESYVPSLYVPSLSLRVWVYKELSVIRSLSSLLSFREKCLDMFGPFPLPFKNLFSLKKASLLCGFMGIRRVVLKKNEVVVFLNPSFWESKPFPFFLLSSFKKDFFYKKPGGFCFKTSKDDDFFVIFNEIYNRLHHEL